MQKMFQCLLADYKIKGIMSFNTDNSEILMCIDFYILLVDDPYPY